MAELVKEEEIRKYFSKLYGKKVSEIEIKELGSGVIGTGYAIDFELEGKKQRKILKSLFANADLNLNHPSDRARSLLLAHDNYNTMDNHVNSLDVLGLKKDGSLVSIGDTNEYFIIMDEAKGKDFFKDLDEMKDKEEIDGKTRDRIEKIAIFLTKLHKKKHNEPALYRRKIRDTVGSECLMGVLDMYPKELNWISDKEVTELVKKSIEFWGKTKHMHHRLCEIHGDFHPGNIWFNEDNSFTLLDRARGTYGEAADDIAAFIINPIFYSLAKKGNFSGTYKQVFDLFWNTYFKETGDKEMREVLAPYLAFRVAVVCNPMFYNDNFFGNKENAEKTRRKLYNFSLKILNEHKFNPEKIKENLSA